MKNLWIIPYFMAQTVINMIKPSRNYINFVHLIKKLQKMT